VREQSPMKYIARRLCLNVTYFSSLARFVMHLVKLLLLNTKIRKPFAYLRKKNVR
jgi:hypothetical protein